MAVPGRPTRKPWRNAAFFLIPHELVPGICARVPAAAMALARSLAITLRRLTEGASDLVFLDLPRRVAKVLLSLSRDEDGIVRLRMSQQQLAHRAAGTRQSVNAALRGFERRGWIEIRGPGRDGQAGGGTQPFRRRLGVSQLTGPNRRCCARTSPPPMISRWISLVPS